MAASARPDYVSIVVDQPLGPGARHGLGKLRGALQAKGITFRECDTLADGRAGIEIVVGHGDSRAVAHLLDTGQMRAPTAPESLLIKRLIHGPDVVLVIGGDDRGLMYGLLEVAERIGWASDGEHFMTHLRDAREAPAVRERSLSIYTMHKAHFEQRFFNDAYWARYLDMLAENRFNTFALLFAYESSGYFAPPYPYFFDVDGFPQIRVRHWSKEMQARYLTALNRLIAMAHARGLRFSLGIWDHIYRGGVQQGASAVAVAGNGDPLKARVVGVTEDNLLPYSVAALQQLLERVPNLDILQFRMHGESGLTVEEMDSFWARIFDLMGAGGKEIRFDARVKGLPHRLIDLALSKGVRIRLCTKYWMEQMGLPFHPTHIHPRNQMDRRHGYADLMRYPQQYRILWRLWNGGTSRVLLWGDPNYVRRFVASTRLYDGDGFDVNEPLATKMAAQDHEQPPFDLLKPERRYYDWEFERYWHFFQLFGRLGYRPDAPLDACRVAFQRRFGGGAPHIERALHLASGILPRIVAYNYPYHLFPTTRGWIEKERMGDLPEYAEALPSDTQQFLSIAEEAAHRIDGGESAKVRPQRTSAWFQRVATEVLDLVERAEGCLDGEPSNEWSSTMTDLCILAHLGLYHSRRIHAGLHWALYQRSGDLHELDDAIAGESRAIEAWRGLVEAAGDAYADDLMMGRRSAGLSGHWRDELSALEEGLCSLRLQREAHLAARPAGAPAIAHVPVRTTKPGRDLVIRATVSAAAALRHVQVGYGADSVVQQRDLPVWWGSAGRSRSSGPGGARR